MLFVFGFGINMHIQQTKLSTATILQLALVPAVLLNHILALFVVVLMVVMSTFDPRWHGDTADNDLLGQQHTNGKTSDTVTKNSYFKHRRNKEDGKQPDTNTHKVDGTNRGLGKGLWNKLARWLEVGILYVPAIYCYIRIARNVNVPTALPPKQRQALLELGHVEVEHCRRPKHK